MKKILLTKILASIILFLGNIFNGPLSAQISCPYYIENQNCETVRVAYEIVDNSCNTSCVTTVTLASGGIHYISSTCCPSFDIYVGVNGIWLGSSWSTTFATLGVNGIATCPNGPAPFDSQPMPAGSCQPNLTIQWYSTHTFIQ